MCYSCGLCCYYYSTLLCFWKQCNCSDGNRELRGLLVLLLIFLCNKLLLFLSNWDNNVYLINIVYSCNIMKSVAELCVYVYCIQVPAYIMQHLITNCNFKITILMFEYFSWFHVLILCLLIIHFNYKWIIIQDIVNGLIINGISLTKDAINMSFLGVL